MSRASLYAYFSNVIVDSRFRRRWSGVVTMIVYVVMVWVPEKELASTPAEAGGLVSPVVLVRVVQYPFVYVIIVPHACQPLRHLQR
jgi:hypothetical protein